MRWACVLLGVLTCVVPAAAQVARPLSLTDDAAIAQCGTMNGLAGWLQQIDAQGEYVHPPARLYCVTPEPPKMWHVDIGFDAGNAFSIVDGRFVPATVPSVTLLVGAFELSTSSYFYGARFFEQDTHLHWYQRESTTRRWSVYADVAHYLWPGGSELTGQAGLRWRVR